MQTLGRNSAGWLVGSVLILAAGVLAPTVRAADDAAPVLEEIIVTAQKREQNLQSVGTSITALDAAALSRVGLSDVTSIASQTPGMQYNQYAATITVYNLRGVSQNDYSDHQEAPIAVYADDVYIASMGALAGSLFDLQRVEVLRGPQGTLFGRNATGGLIQYISEKPQFDSEGSLQLTAGNYGTANSEGVLNMALNDQLAVRLSLATDYHDGYITNRIGPALENQKQYAGRLQFLYKPSAQGEFLLKLYSVNNDDEKSSDYSFAASHSDSTGRGVLIGPTSTANCPNLNGGCTPGGDLNGYRNPSNNPFNQAEWRTPIFNRTVGGATLHATWNFDPFTLTSVTDYLRLQKRYGEDSDISPEPFFIYDTLQHYHQFSQELHLSGSDGALKWITGLYYLDYHTRDYEGLIAIPAIGGLSYNNFVLTTQSESAFGQLEYDFLPKLTGIVGLRYTSDQKTFDYVYTNAPQTPVIYDQSTNPNAAKTFDNVTGKAELDYKVEPDSMVYASVNRGAKGGGWSAPNSGTVNPSTLPYKQETLTDYEIGEKTTFWDGRARINSSVFYYDYRDYQGFFLVGFTTVVKNIDATLKGAEIELALAPLRDMNLQLGLSHLETSAKNVPLPAGGFTVTEMPQAPKWSVNAMASYEWPIPTGRLTAEADAKWNAHQYMELLNASSDYEGNYIVGNARLTYTSANNHWEIAGWVKNFTDRLYLIYGLDISSVGVQQFVYGPPRTYGATFKYRWGN